MQNALFARAQRFVADPEIIKLNEMVSHMANPLSESFRNLFYEVFLLEKKPSSNLERFINSNKELKELLGKTQEQEKAIKAAYGKLKACKKALNEAKLTQAFQNARDENANVLRKEKDLAILEDDLAGWKRREDSSKKRAACKDINALLLEAKGELQKARDILSGIQGTPEFQNYKKLEDNLKTEEASYQEVQRQYDDSLVLFVRSLVDAMKRLCAAGVHSDPEKNLLAQMRNMKSQIPELSCPARP